MWALVEVFGVIFLPLASIIFRNLPDRGWALSKALGMLILSFSVWSLLMYVPLFPFSQIFILGVALILVAIGILLWMRFYRDVLDMVRQNRVYVILAEIVFLGMVFLLGWVRSFGPDIRSFEMFMDEGFLAAIMRSTHFPPNDMWFSGYSINYYYYAHYMIAVMAKFLGQSPSIAFNTGICIFFGLCAVNLFGLTANVVAWARHLRRQTRQQDAEPLAPANTVLPPLLPAIPYGFLSCLMALVFGNLAATRQWWINHDSVNPDLYGFWFGSTRVLSPPATTINEFPAFSFLLSCFHAHVLTLAFTIFAMALAFNFLLSGQGKGFHIFGSGWRIPITLLCSALALGVLFVMNSWDYPTYLALAIICIVLQQWLAHTRHFSFVLVRNILLPVAALVVLSLALFLPFLLTFVSPSQGIALVTPNLRSLLNEELLIYGLFAFVFLSLLLVSVFMRPVLWRSAPKSVLPPVDVAFGYDVQPTSVDVLLPTDTANSLSSTTSSAFPDAREAVVVIENTESTSLPVVALLANEERSSLLLATPSVLSDATSVPAGPPPLKRSRWSQAFSPAILLLTVCVAYLIACLVALRVIENSTTFVASSSLALLGFGLALYHRRHSSHAFVLLLGSLAFALVALCEIVYLRDVFADGDYERMNTVFKFYFQAWVLLSVGCAAGVFFIIECLLPSRSSSRSSVQPTRRHVNLLQYGVFGLWSLFFAVLVIASMVYPIFAPYDRYVHTDASSSVPHLTQTLSLDGLAYMATCKPPFCDYDTSGDYQAIRWLNANVSGDPGIVEAVGDDYSDYGRISAFTGLSDPIGWIYHEYQWRVVWITKSPENNAVYQHRAPDVDQIYTDTDPKVVLSLMAQDHVQYLYVGELEKEKYAAHANLYRYAAFMQVVYDANGVIIFKVR